MKLDRRVGSATAVGRVRNHNEDGLIADDKLGIFAVADGMGGHRGGEVASKTALDALRKALKSGAEVADAVRAANRAVYDRSIKSNDLQGMGTTITVGMLDQSGRGKLAHVGDSRAYLIRDGDFNRITTDHSLMAELIAAGELTEAQAEVDPRRSMITRALGLDLTVEVDVQDLELRAGDRVLFCSDGLTTMMRDPAIADALSQETDPQTAAQRLVDDANRAGGVDNITVVVIDFAATRPESSQESNPENNPESSQESSPESSQENNAAGNSPTRSGWRRWFRRTA